MRTTLTIRDELYDAVRRRAFEERRTLGDIVNELIASGLDTSSSSRPRTLGAFTGQIRIADDFDDELSEFTDAMNESIEP
ncbi:MAG TPA: hypothetical protein VL068_08290 [Microthrixaceae bacterium]|nr:hypothetical protein [Microthrixaceae bacterium]